MPGSSNLIRNRLLVPELELGAVEQEGGKSVMSALGRTWGLMDSIPVGGAAGDGVDWR